ncbi:hypothetical protein HDV01_001684 [Terramyces sp. JEL0728]|nr:hypothetical protein HDV01_001684 [Terramyces sp. JEL0728]
MFTLNTLLCYLLGTALCYSTRVSLDYGTFQGIHDPQSSTISYLNIPYAKPPIGPLRFAPPQKPNNYLGVQNAAVYGNGCIQNPTSGGNNGTGLTISEDCLNLNVYKSASSKTLLPVVVYVVGGGFNSGYAANPYYNGKSILSKIQSDIIIVTFNYRVGAFGFLSSKELQEHGYLNAGLLDQVMVFKWVKQYISLFGGDPNLITAFGQSAGAISIGTLMTGTGLDLFDKAIMHSGGPAFTLKHPVENQKSFDDVVNSLNCTVDTVTCLQTGNPQSLYTLTESFQFFPVMDGKLIRKQPLSNILSGNFRQIPVMLNNVLDEGNIFMQPIVKSPNYVTPVEQQAFYFLNSSAITELKSLYPPTTEYSFQSVGDAYGDLGFQCPTLLMGQVMEKSYKSVFTHQSAFLPAPPGVGIAHGSDIPFTWFYEPKLTEQEKSISKFVGTSWTNFVLGKLDWQAYNGTMATIDQEIGTADDNHRIEKCEFWKEAV